ncbi:MAG: NUDIX hydrolase [Acidobacteria bacterium]|nr:MAG: NUDIX hydrolase [Acidobacteriota bacterium]
MAGGGAVRRWPTLESGPVADHGIFGVQQVRRRSPRTGVARTYQVLHMPDWVNVVALTGDGEMVLVEQYRHGIDRLTLEIPGGAVDAGEAPADAAARELREETGFAGDPPVLLGRVSPNPAIQTNACTTWLIRRARRVAAPQPDEGEDLAVRLVPRSEIDALVAAGDVDHALVIAAFYWLERYERRVAGGSIGGL